MWTLRGRRAEVPAAGKNQKIAVYGAINFRTGQVHYLLNARKNADTFNVFLKRLLEAKRQRQLVLVLDNASYHVTRKTLDLLTEHEHHVRVVWLPKYSPELNAIEGLWGYLKRSALNNYFHVTMERLQEAVDAALRELNRNPQTALSLTYRTSRNIRRTA